MRGLIDPRPTPQGSKDCRPAGIENWEISATDKQRLFNTHTRCIRGSVFRGYYERCLVFATTSMHHISGIWCGNVNTGGKSLIVWGMRYENGWSEVLRQRLWARHRGERGWGLVVLEGSRPLPLRMKFCKITLNWLVLIHFPRAIVNGLVIHVFVNGLVIHVFVNGLVIHVFRKSNRTRLNQFTKCPNYKSCYKFWIVNFKMRRWNCG